MLTSRCGRWFGCVIAVLTLATAPPAHADDVLPDGLIRIIVGFAPGGAADRVARLVTEQLNKDGVKNVVVENRPGASSRLSIGYVKRAVPDGLTLLLGTSPAFTIFPHTYKNLDYDPDRDFRPIALLVEIPTAIVTGVEQPYDTLSEYVQWAQQHPNQATLGLASQGSSGQLGVTALGKDIGVTFSPVAYKGASPMLVDVVSSRVSIGWDAVASMVPLYQGGKIKFLGLSGTQRLASLPGVPTAKEQGYDQFEHATSFYAIYAPVGLPDNTARALETVLLRAAGNNELAQKLEQSGLIVKPMGQAQLAERMRVERQFWGPIVQASGVSFE